MATLTELNLYPIKSCGGISLREATLTPAGLMHEHIYDREWMVVDQNGVLVSQRDFPKMALISPRIKSETMELRAPGMLRLEIPLGLADPDTAPTLEVDVWGTKLKAYDCDDITAAWFSNAIGTTCRLARFHPHAKRLASEKWTGDVEAPALFADAFPYLVISQASLDDLNEKLSAQGRAALPMNRFRPNIVVTGIGAFEEDYAATLDFGDCALKPVKPCARCTVPSVDQATAEVGPDPLDILRTYRVDPKVDGGITFGMNAIVVKGEKQVLRVGQEVGVELAF
jgi:uncharacterized protein